MNGVGLKLAVVEVAEQRLVDGVKVRDEEVAHGAVLADPKSNGLLTSDSQGLQSDSQV